MKAPLFIDSNYIEVNSSYIELVNVLKDAFATGKTVVPQRHHHDFSNPGMERDNTLLLMPAHNPGEDSGVKVVTINPHNGEQGLPAIQGSYLYMDAVTGELKAIVEAKTLTAKRTAATSALASKYLSREDSSSLLMIGTGALSLNLIRAHAAVRPIKNVYIWGRDIKKAEHIVNQLADDAFSSEAIAEVQTVISKVSIVSCATLSETPLVFGSELVPGQHIDLVGAYRPNMREADDVTIKKSSVFLDSYESGLKESGDIAIPIASGAITKEDIKADLFELCSNIKEGRSTTEQITLFKSVGHALEDLAAAKYYYQKYAHDNL